MVGIALILAKNEKDRMLNGLDFARSSKNPVNVIQWITLMFGICGLQLRHIPNYYSPQLNSGRRNLHK